MLLPMFRTFIFRSTFAAAILFSQPCLAEIIPLPVSDVKSDGIYELRPSAGIEITSEHFPAEDLAAAGIKWIFPVGKNVALRIISPAVLPAARRPTGEGYYLKIDAGGIALAASTKAGFHNGLQTLRQLIERAPSESGVVKLTHREISDEPRYAWRGFMLDESREFTGEAGVKRILDAMARYKLNRFHWHLTDSAGWRIEIKKYPKLTEIGSRGSETDRRKDAPRQFYTQEQIRGIIAYARARGITVVPEIDMPGHADAAVRAYPEHDGGGYTGKTEPEKWNHFTFNPAKSETLRFLDDILAETAALFPDAGIIHFGGDEVHFGWHKWPELPEVKELMARENLKDLAGVEAWFNRRMAATVNQLGFKTGGWDEITARGLPTEKTVIWWWRHDKPQVLHEALAAGYPVILTPRRPCYLDFLQAENHTQGRRWDGINPLRDCYDFPAGLKLTPAQEKHVYGIQGSLWTEAAASQERRDFLTWPRLIALAEAAWTSAGRKDFRSFEQRLRPEISWLETHGIAAYDPFAPSPEITDRKKNDGSYLDNPE